MKLCNIEIYCTGKDRYVAILEPTGIAATGNCPQEALSNLPEKISELIGYSKTLDKLAKHWLDD